MDFAEFYQKHGSYCPNCGLNLTIWIDPHNTTLAHQCSQCGFRPYDLNENDAKAIAEAAKVRKEYKP